MKMAPTTITMCLWKLCECILICLSKFSYKISQFFSKKNCVGHQTGTTLTSVGNTVNCEGKGVITTSYNNNTVCEICALGRLVEKDRRVLYKTEYPLIAKYIPVLTHIDTLLSCSTEMPVDIEKFLYYHLLKNVAEFKGHKYLILCWMVLLLFGKMGFISLFWALATGLCLLISLLDGVYKVYDCYYWWWFITKTDEGRLIRDTIIHKIIPIINIDVRRY